MKCRKCNTELQKQAVFCPCCGEKQAVDPSNTKMPECHVPNVSGSTPNEKPVARKRKKYIWAAVICMGVMIAVLGIISILIGGEYISGTGRPLLRQQELALRMQTCQTVSVGEHQIVAITDDGRAVATGNNNCGECDVEEWSDLKAVVAGDGQFTLGLRNDGIVLAAGNNYSGQLDVAAWTDIVAIASSGMHTVGLKADGTVVAAGSNDFGQCDVQTFENIEKIYAHNFFTLAIDKEGKVHCAGDSRMLDEISQWEDIFCLAVSEGHVVGLRYDGTVVAAGNDDRTDIGDWEDIVSVAVSNYHTVGLKADGTVVETGLEDIAHLVTLWDDIVAIAVDNNSVFGIKSDGSLVSGSNLHRDYTDSVWNSDIVALYAYDGKLVTLREDGHLICNGYAMPGFEKVKVPD